MSSDSPGIEMGEQRSQLRENNDRKHSAFYLAFLGINTAMCAGVVGSTLHATAVSAYRLCEFVAAIAVPTNNYCTDTTATTSTALCTWLVIYVVR